MQGHILNTAGAVFTIVRVEARAPSKNVIGTMAEINYMDEIEFQKIFGKVFLTCALCRLDAADLQVYLQVHHLLSTLNATLNFVNPDNLL